MDTDSYRDDIENIAEDKRNGTYVFSAMSDLKKYFYQYFSRSEIQDVINEAKKGFVIRQGIPEEESQLQFINKCEVELLNRVRSNSGS